MIGAIIGAAGSLLGAGINAYSSSKAADSAFDRQKELMRLQNQYAVENWNRETSYNDPKAQMQRLKDAGLNPHLVYGSGSVGLESPGIAAPTAPSAPMQSTAPGNFGAAVSDAINTLVGVSQADNLDSSTKKNLTDAAGKEIENEFSRRTLDDRVSSVGLSNKWTKEQISNMQQQTWNLHQQCDMLVAQMNLMVRDQDLKEAELVNLKKQGILLDDQHEKNRLDIDWYSVVQKANVYETLTRAGCNKAMAGQITATLPLMLQGMSLDNKGKAIQNGIAGIDFALKDKYGEAQIWVDMSTKAVGAVTDFIDSLNPAKKIVNIAGDVIKNFTK